MDDYQRYIAYDHYSRYLDRKHRREEWPETVARYCDFFQKKYPQEFPRSLIEAAIVQMKVMPSMRALMTAGPALEKDNVAGYNCSYVPMDNLRAFDEMIYILMCGTGVGFSVERQYINQLPTVPVKLRRVNVHITVEDSKYGWADSFRQLLAFLYTGFIPKWTVEKVRPAGARLKTFGGRASGPKPLVDLFEFTIRKFQEAQGRKLTSLEVHDLACMIAEVVISGGVRRSALISLSNLSDERMRDAKSGQWWESEKHRSNSNNSVAYSEKPELAVLIREWLALYLSKSGERGIFNREGALLKAKATGRRIYEGIEFGTNPCGEIILRPQGFCNLSEVVIRAEDSLDDLLYKVELATILGTFQATLTNFKYLRKEWKKNADEERLLGVSLTGLMDHPILSRNTRRAAEWLSVMKAKALSTNKYWSTLLGIKPSVAITTVKPSGTVSQLVNSSSGIHPRYAKYYVRTIRGDDVSPLTLLLKAARVPNEPLLGKPGTTVFSFPQKSPDGSRIRTGISALGQLNHYLMVRKYWCEHNPSITVYVREREWTSVLAWVDKHFDEIGGISFLPYDDHIYEQAPYQPITKKQYEKLVKNFPPIDWSCLTEFEQEDQTTSHHELACTADHCEV